MVRRCSVPKCWTMADSVYTCKDISERNTLHSLPFTTPDRWKEWLIKCPFYKKFSLRKLENIKICNHHFIPQHIFEKDGKRRLTKDAVPLLKLPDYYNGETGTADVLTKDTKALEIGPVRGNKPVDFKIVDYDPVVVSKTEETFKSQSAACTGNRFCDKDIFSEVRIKPQGNIPVDHNMYTLHMQTEVKIESMSIESDQCALKQPAVNVDILEEKSIKEEIVELSDEETLGTSLDWMLDEGSEIDVDTPQNHVTVCSDKNSDSLFECLNIKLQNSETMDLESEALDEDCVKKVFSNESLLMDLQISSQNIAMESKDQNCIYLCGNVTPDPVREEIIVLESDTQIATLENSEGILGVEELLVLKLEGLSEVQIESEGNCNLPIDHNKYTLSPQTPDISKCLSVEGDQQVNKPLQECTLNRKLQDEIIDLSHEETLSPPADCMSSQIFTDMPQYQFNDQLSDYVSGSFAQPLGSQHLESETIDPNLEDQVAPLFINEAICNLLTNAVADASSQTDSNPTYPLLINWQEEIWNPFFVNVPQNPWEHNLTDDDNNLPSYSVSNVDSQSISNKQPQIIVTPNIFQLSTESEFAPQAVKSLHKLSDEKSLKENNNQPMYCNLQTQDKCDNSFTGVNNVSSDQNKINSLLPKKSSPKKQTLESLVAQLLDSVESEPQKTCTESHLEPSGTVVQSHLSANMTSKKKSQTCFKSSSRRIPILSKRVRINKEGSTPNERALRDQNTILKAKLKNLNDKYVRLKSRTQYVYTEAKQFLKNYSFLSDKGKFLVDFQLRLAKARPAATRYSDEEKKFAVNLYRISREGYRFLQQYMKLPGRSTISNVDSSIQPQPTINENNLETFDRYC